MKIGIIGYGYVGQAIHYILDNSIEKLIVDPYKKVEGQVNISEIKDSDFIFVCVGTPMREDGTIDLTGFKDVMDSLADYDGIIVIKSTVPYEDIPDRGNIVYNPEFLSQNNFIEDMINTKVVILGGLVNVASEVENLYYEYTYIVNSDNIDYKYCSIKEASDFKYIRNIHQAYNVLFWNFVQETTGNARLHADILKHLPVSENSQVGMDGQLGYAGACLPKDVKAYNNSKKHHLTQWMDDYNEELHGKLG